jgi:hypothetical protein
MKKIAVFLFAVLLILSVNGSAIEELIIEKSTNALPEPIDILIFGFALRVLGYLGRKTLPQRCLTCPQT